MKKGLTLMEVLMAAVFLIVVLSGIIRLFASCMFLNEDNRNSTVAVTHAQYILEEVRSTAFATIQGMISGGLWDLDTAGLSAAPYNWTTLTNEAVDTSVTPVGNTLEVTVDVSWQDRRGAVRNEQLVTRIANYQ